MPAAQNSTSFFGKKVKRKDHQPSKTEIDARENISNFNQQASSLYAPSPCALRAKKVRQKKVVRIAERRPKRFLPAADTFGKENNQKRGRRALRELVHTYPQSQERPQDLARRQLWVCVDLRCLLLQPGFPWKFQFLFFEATLRFMRLA